MPWPLHRLEIPAMQRFGSRGLSDPRRFAVEAPRVILDHAAQGEPPEAYVAELVYPTIPDPYEGVESGSSSLPEQITPELPEHLVPEGPDERLAALTPTLPDVAAAIDEAIQALYDTDHGQRLHRLMANPMAVEGMVPVDNEVVVQTDHEAVTGTSLAPESPATLDAHFSNQPDPGLGAIAPPLDDRLEEGP